MKSVRLFNLEQFCVVTSLITIKHTTINTFCFLLFFIFFVEINSVTKKWEGYHDVDEQPLMLHIYERTTLTMCLTFQLEVPWSHPKSPTNTFTEALLKPNVTPLHWEHALRTPASSSPWILCLIPLLMRLQDAFVCFYCLTGKWILKGCLFSYCTYRR